VGAHLAIDAARVADPVWPTPRAQVAIDAAARLRVAERASLGLGCTVPVAGALGGTTVGCGLEGTVGY